MWGDKTFIEVAEVIAPMLIGDDEHDVWSSRVGLAALGWLVFVHVPGGLAGVVRDVVLRACRRPIRVAQGIGLPSDRCLVGDGGERIVVGVHEASDRSGAQEGADLRIGKV